jgi:TolA-binding protein
MRRTTITGKKHESCSFKPLLLGFLLLSAAYSTAQESVPQYVKNFQNGAKLYREARWMEAAAEFRIAQEISVNLNEWSQAIYWVILSEMASSDYGSALNDMDELEKKAPNMTYGIDIGYHRARVYYLQGYFEDAILLFKRYSDSISDSNIESANRKAAAFFWIGECLYSMGQFKEAEKFYAWVIAKYPASPKIEVSSYRIDLIKQKKIESELLSLLQWSHEESLRTSEEYQRKIRTFENNLNTYQKRISELTQDSDFVIQDSYLNEPNKNTNADYSQNDLLEKARLLGNEVQQLLDSFEKSRGGSR